MYRSNVLVFLFLLPLCMLFAQEQTVERRAMSLFNQARSYLPNQPQKADSVAQALLSLAMLQKAGSDSLLTRAYYLLGLTNYFKSNTILSATYYRKALETDFINRDLKIREGCLNNLGVIYDLEGNLPEATAVYMESLKIAEQRKDSVSMVQSWINLSLIDRKMGAYDKSLETCEKVIAFSERKKDTINLALGLQNMGLIYSDKGDREKARIRLLQSITLFRAQQLYFYFTQALVDLAKIDTEDGRFDEAELSLEEAMSKVRSFQPVENSLPVLIQYGALMMAKGNAEQAKSYLKKAEQLAVSVHRKDFLAEIYHKLGGVFAREGKMADYEKVMDKYRKLMESQMKARLTSANDQMRNFYEIDLLNRDKIRLEENIKQRNRQLAYAWLAILLMLAAGAVIVIQNIKQQRFVRTLFRLNVEEFRQYSKSDNPSSAEALTESPAYAEALGTLPSFERYQSIVALLEREKLYLVSEFNLQTLSTRLASNQKYISQAINEHSGTNFAGLVNRYRIQEARKLILSAPVDQPVNLNDVAFRAGFNNRVSFYRNFKEETGFTPSEFLKMSRTQRQPQPSGQ
jgi:tetratricopeptide (TPR) repeat protein